MTDTFEDNPTFFDDAYFADPAAALTAAAARTPVVRTLSLEGEPVWVLTRPEHVPRMLDDSVLSVDKRHAAPGFKGFTCHPRWTPACSTPTAPHMPGCVG
jgi:cytochrome P450